MRAFCSAIRPVRHRDGAWQVAVFGDVWQTVLAWDGATTSPTAPQEDRGDGSRAFAWDGTPPAPMPEGGWSPYACVDFWGDAYLLLLATPTGGKGTWVLDQRLKVMCNLDDPVLDKVPGFQQILSGPAGVLRSALRSQLVIRSDEMIGAALRGMTLNGLKRLLSMAPGQARSVPAGAGVGSLSLPSGGRVPVSGEALSRIFELPAGWTAPALQAGRVRIPALSADGPVDAVFLVGRHEASPTFYCVERQIGLCYYLVCRGGQAPVAYFPNDNLLVSSNGLDATAARTLLGALDADIATLAFILAAMDVQALPERTEGLGLLAFGNTAAAPVSGPAHATLLETAALDSALAAVPAGRQPPTLCLASSTSALDQVGPVEDLFPELAGRVIRGDTEALSLGVAVTTGTELLPLEGPRSSEDGGEVGKAARLRIGQALGRYADATELAGRIRAACTPDGQPRLAIALAFRPTDRRLPELMGFYGRLAKGLVDRFGPSVVLLDSGDDGAQAGLQSKAAAEAQAGPKEMARSWADALRAMAGGAEVEIIDLAGMPARDRLCWLRQARFFVASLGSDGLPRLRWFLDTPGLVLLEPHEVGSEQVVRLQGEKDVAGEDAAPLYFGRMDAMGPAPQEAGEAGQGRRSQLRSPALHEDGLIQRVSDLIASRLDGSGIAVRPVAPELRPRKRSLLSLFGGRRRRERDGDGLIPLAQLRPTPVQVLQRPGLRCIDVTKDYPTHHGMRRVLDQVSFDLQRGQKLGILGRNGAGKSTLIRMIGGVDFPTAGRIERDMTVSWPLGFSGAFQGSLSGVDNLRFICRIYGLDYKNTYAYVEDFAELGKQLGEPVKHYSTGMRARLAFALSIAIEFDCYLIDEVIMAGDKRFSDRCQHELFEKRADRSLVLVSHDMGIIRTVCDRAAVIHERRLHLCDSVADAVSLYERM